MVFSTFQKYVIIILILRTCETYFIIDNTFTSSATQRLRFPSFWYRIEFNILPILKKKKWDIFICRLLTPT